MTSHVIGGSYVIARVAARGGTDYQLAIEVACVVKIISASRARPVSDLESLVGVDRGPGERVRLRLRRGERLADLDVPGAGLEVGRWLAGACEVPPLVAGALARSSLRGAIRDGDHFVYLVDLDRMWSGSGESVKQGESS